MPGPSFGGAPPFINPVADWLQPSQNLSTPITELSSAEPVEVRGFSPLTTASFTVPDNSLVVVCTLVQSALSGTATATISDSGTHSWTPGSVVAIAQSGGSQWGGLAGVYYSYFDAAATITVTGTFTNATAATWQHVIGVRIFSGAARSQTGAGSNTNVPTPPTGIGYTTLTTTKPGSLFVGSYQASEQATATPFIPIDGTITTFSFVDPVTEDVSQAIFASRDPSGTPEATTVGGVSKNSSNTENGLIAALEILPAVPSVLTSDTPPDLGLAAQTAAFDTSVVGSVAALTLAAPTPTFDTTLAGAISGITLAAPTASFNITLTGVVANDALATSGAINTTVSGLVKNVALTAPAGSVLTTSGIVGVTTNIALAAPAGTLSTTAIGSSANVAEAAIAGTANTTLSGPVAQMTLAAPIGTPLVTVTSAPVNVALSSPIGKVGVDRVFGVVANLALSATAGTIAVTALGVSANLQSASTGAANVTATGSVSNLALASPSGALIYPIVIQGVTANTAISSPAGSIAIQAVGATANMALATPTPTVNSSVIGVTTNVALAAPTGALIYPIVLQGAVANLSLQAPNGTPLSSVVGPVSNTSLAATAGHTDVSTIGFVANASLQSFGSVNTSIPGIASNLALASPAGTTATKLAGPTANLALAGVAGTFKIDTIGVSSTLVLASSGVVDTHPIGPSANLSIQASAGSESFLVPGSSANLAINSPPGQLQIPGKVVGPTANLDLASTGVANTTLSGLVANLNLASTAGSIKTSVLAPSTNLTTLAPAGTFATSVLGPTANLQLGSIAGSINTSVTAPSTNLTAQPGAGTFDTNLLGPTAAMSEIAPLGTLMIAAAGFLSDLQIGSTGVVQVSIPGLSSTTTLMAANGSLAIAAQAAPADLSTLALPGQVRIRQDDSDFLFLFL